jgi:hypothetical protein
MSKTGWVTVEVRGNRYRSDFQIPEDASEVEEVMPYLSMVIREVLESEISEK